MIKNGDGNNFHMEFKILAGDFSVAGKAASEIKRILHQMGVPAAVIRKVAIATYEAEMNIVIHSYGGTICLDVEPQRVSITCIDKGPGISDLKKAMEEGFSTASDQIRELGFGAGMGLPNMKRCTDHFRISSQKGQGTKVEMVINIP